VDGVSPVFGWNFESQDYGSFLCFSLQEYSTITATPGAAIVQSQRRNQWGMLLPPGLYASLKIHTEFDVCLFEPYDGHVLVSTVFGGAYGFSGTPANSNVPATGGGTYKLV
jgi:hypothetical protein